MMRRGLASLVMGLSLLVASGSWAGFILSRTVLDPGRSERLADHLLDNTEVRATITDRLADAVEAQIPAGVPVSRETIELGADAALDDPRVEAVIRDGIVQAHQDALNGVDQPVTLDATALGQAARDAAVAQQPDLDPVLPAAPALEVELPRTGLAWLGSVKDAVDRFTLIGAVLSLLGISLAFLLARNRPAALRRVALWAFGASAFWILAAYAIPAILEQVAPSSVAIATAAIDVFFGAMIGPAVTLAVIGLILLVVSIAWPLLIRRRGAALLDRGAHPRQPQPDRPRYQAEPAPRPANPQPGGLAAAATVSSPGRYPSPAPYQPAVAASGPATPPYRPVAPQMPAPASSDPSRTVPAQPRAPQPAPDPTRTFPQIISDHRPQPSPDPPPQPPTPSPAISPAAYSVARPSPLAGPGQPGDWGDGDDPEDETTWVEGVGYVGEETERSPLTPDRLPTNRLPRE